MQALIIGGAGFVGSYLAAHCMNNWHWKVAITKMDSESLELPGTDVYNMTPGSYTDPGSSEYGSPRLYLPSGSTEFGCAILEEAGVNHRCKYQGQRQPAGCNP